MSILLIDEQENEVDFWIERVIDVCQEIVFAVFIFELMLVFLAPDVPVINLLLKTLLPNVGLIQFLKMR
jgi:hypothetical protein